jgi:aldehyde dehydrogenase (NAD+)
LRDCRQFYIGGKWVEPSHGRDWEVINPANEQPFATISLGSGEDVDRAVEAARSAFDSFSSTSVEERIALLQRIIEAYKAKAEEMAETISSEMGAPLSLARAAQAPSGLGHLLEIVKVLGQFKFEEINDTTLMRKEAVGICGLITPWNWPINQILAKVAPALAAGCTMVLKPSEMAPLSAYLLAQILDQAGVPAGGRHGFFHRQHARWDCGGAGCRAHGKAGNAGTGWKICVDYFGRCRSRTSGETVRAGMLPQYGTILQRSHPALGSTFQDEWCC